MMRKCLPSLMIHFSPMRMWKMLLQSAKSAVNQRALDIGWRRRLAKAALWTNRPGLALQQYMFIANYTRTDSDIKTDISIGKRMALSG